VLKVLKRSKDELNDDFNLKLILQDIRETKYNLKMVMKKTDCRVWNELPHNYILCGTCSDCKLLKTVTA